MQYFSCEFCNSRVGPIMPQDMGEGRVMHLCPRCRAYIKQGEELSYRQGNRDCLVILDGKEIAKAVISELHRTVRNATGPRNF